MKFSLGSSYTCCSIDTLHPALATHLHSQLAQTARYDPNTKCFRFVKNGVTMTCGGVHKMLRNIYYPHYKDNRSRRGKNVQIRGSNKKLGVRVDTEIANMTEGKPPPKKMHPMTSKVLSYFALAGETLQACQVPVRLTTESIKVTQADIITMDTEGRLILYELKTGAPVGFNHTQGMFQVAEIANEVRCTKKNIWQLQLAYTRMALEAAGIPIYQSFVIQVFEKKGEGYKLDLQEAPAWTFNLPKNPRRSQPLLQATKFLKPKKTVGKRKRRIAPPKHLFSCQGK